MPLTNDDLDQKFRGILMVPAELEAFVDQLNTEERRLLSEHCESIAASAAFTASYLSERYGYGCGDQGHDDAVKAANKVRRIVRCKAFGYNETRDIKV